MNGAFMKKLLFLAVLISAFFTACGGDSGSKGSDPEDGVGRDSTDQGGDKKPLPDIPALAIDSVDTEDDLTACVSSNEGDSVYVKAAYSIFRCDDELWKSVGFVLQRVKSKDKLPECNRDLTGLMVLVADSSVAWRCVLGEWVEMGKAYKQDKDLPNCTSNRVDETVFVESDGSMLVCDGRWREYEPEDKLYCGSRSFDPAEEFCMAEKLYDLCGDKDFDPAMQFCYEDSLYALCGGEEYRPTRRFCVRDTLYDMCDDSVFDPAKKFCFDDELYDLCGGEDYRPTKQFCASSVVYDFCNGDAYDPTKKFCVKDNLYDLCGGRVYDVDKERCESGKVMGTCGTETYDASEKFCSGNQTYDLCGGKKYDIAAEFCSGNQVYSKCEGSSYDVTAKFCSGNQLYDLCGGESYNVSMEFCSGNQVYGKCGGTSYDVTAKFCSGNQLYDLCGESYNVSMEFCQGNRVYSKCGGTSYDVTAKFCSGNQLYDLCGGESYNVSMEFCSGNQVYSKCGGTSYDVMAKFCSGSQLYDLCGGESYDVLAEFCSDNRVYDLCGGQSYDVRFNECQGGSVVDVTRCCSVSGICSSESERYNYKTHFCDSRPTQYKIYRMTTIGSQTWMAENLNYAYTGVPFDHGYYTSDSTSWCYDNDPANCAKYGRLYTWAAAMDSVGKWSTNGKGCGYTNTCSPTYPVRGICPEGWHLPSYDEWNTLFTAVGGESTAAQKLKATTGWEAYSGITNEDAYGFSALPAGRRLYNGDFDNVGYSAHFWSATADDSNYAYRMYLSYGSDNASLGEDYKNLGFSVRCLQD